MLKPLVKRGLFFSIEEGVQIQVGSGNQKKKKRRKKARLG